jgi:hypothetical protein
MHPNYRSPLRSLRISLYFVGNGPVPFRRLSRHPANKGTILLFAWVLHQKIPVAGKGEVYYEGI